jgi:tetratricopeptide (TPR) repeat protein
MMSPEQSSNKIGKTVGEKLRAARVAQHYTQSQLAAPDFSVSYISAIERGQIHPSLRALEILATRLGLSSTQLLPNRSQPEDRLSMPLSTSERDDDEVELSLLEAHIAIKEGAIEQAIAQLSKLSTKRLKRPQQLQQRYLLSWAYYKDAQFQECEYMLTEALQLAKDLSDQYMTLRILSLQATAYTAMRNYPQALLSYQRCLNTLETAEPRDLFFTTQIYMHMGQYYMQFDNVDQALEMFHKALEISANYTTSHAVQVAYVNISQYYTEAKSYDLATHYAYKNLRLADLENHKHLRSELYHYLGQALLKGDEEQARAFIDDALKQKSVTLDKLARASLYTSSAQWHFKRQALADADECVQQALVLAQPFGDTLIGAEAHILAGRIQYALQREEAGDLHFVAGLGMLENLHCHEELANESVKYAQLLEQHGKEREAFAYFRKAFQSQQKLGR